MQGNRRPICLLLALAPICCLQLALELPADAGRPVPSAKAAERKAAEPRIWVTTPLKRRIHVAEFSGGHDLEGSSRWELSLDVPGRPLDMRKLLGQRLTVSMRLMVGGVRHVNGYVTDINVVPSNRDHSSFRYQLTLVPWLELLGKTADCQIHQNLSYPEIVRRVFGHHRFARYRFELTRRYPVHPYTVQYRETDRNFVNRLLEQVGIYYYYEHRSGSHELVLTDSMRKHRPGKGYETFSANPEFKPEPLRIQRWNPRMSLVPGRYATADYDFRRADQAKLEVSSALKLGHRLDSFEIYDYPGEYHTPKAGKFIVRLRLEESVASFATAMAEAATGGIVAGRVITLRDHPDVRQNGRHLVTAAQLSVWTINGETTMSTSFSTVPMTATFRPQRSTPKPVVQGVQTAVVVGPPDHGRHKKRPATSHTDALGRVRVRFHWTRERKGKRASSAWLRVVRPLPYQQDASGLVVPKVGQEVLVHFREGDPDRPIVTGILYRPSDAKVRGWPGRAVHIPR